MAEVITYETLREIQRNEKKGEKLVDLTDVFYTDVREYLNRDVQDDISATEIRNATAILSDIQDRRERKILSLALRTVRSKETPNTSEMTTLETDLFEGLMKMLETHKENIENGSAVQESVEGNAQESEESAEKIETEEKTNENSIETESSEETAVETEPTEDTAIETKPAEDTEIESETTKEITIEVNPTEESAIKTETGQAIEPKEPQSSESGHDGKSYIKLKILEDVPEIIGADLKSYGPFKGGDIVELPSENAKIFIDSGKATGDTEGI